MSYIVRKDRAPGSRNKWIVRIVDSDGEITCLRNEDGSQFFKTKKAACEARDKAVAKEVAERLLVKFKEESKTEWDKLWAIFDLWSIVGDVHFEGSLALKSIVDVNAIADRLDELHDATMERIEKRVKEHEERERTA